MCPPICCSIINGTCATPANWADSRIDINVTTVWNDYNGSGVHVGVFDDEVEYTHHDLNNNYDASRHVFINGIRQIRPP